MSIDSTLSSNELKKRAVNSVGSLFVRQILIKAFGFIGYAILAGLLLPETFGKFNMLSFLVLFFFKFTDFGFTASLLRKKEPVTKDELSTAFTVQQIISLIFFLFIFLGASSITDYYDIGDENIPAVRLLSIVLLLSSLKTAPNLLLQRQLHFNKIAVAEIAEVLTYQILTISLAYWGMGIWSLVYGSIGKVFIGLLITWLFQPTWVPLGINFSILKSNYSYSIQIQIGILLGVAYEGIVPLITGPLLGPKAVGLLGLVMLLSNIIVEITYMISKVMLRVYASAQDNKELIRSYLERDLFITCTILFLFIGLSSYLVYPFVSYVLSESWRPVSGLYSIFAISLVFMTIVVPFLQVFKAQGDAKSSIYYILILVLTQVVITVLLIKPLGVYSFVVATILGRFTGMLFVMTLGIKRVNPNLLSSILPPLVSLIFSCASMFLLKEISATWWNLIIIFIAGIAVYLLILLMISGKMVASEIEKIFPEKFSKNRRVALLLKRFTTSARRLDMNLIKHKKL